MDDDNPYRAPVTHGQVWQPNSWLRRGWSDVPGVVAAVIGILLMTVAGAGSLTLAISGRPGIAVAIGVGLATWALIWFAAAQTWWKGYLVSSIIWTGVGLAPLWAALAMAFVA